MKQYNRSGMSLPVVLITMVLATLVGTALYRVLTKEGESSAAQMQQASAVAAAKAGLEATKSWLTFHSVETKGLLETYRDTNAAGTFVPVRIPLAATVAANSREQFSVLLTGIYFVESSPEVSIKVQVIGTGKAGAQAVLTAVLKLEGMVTVENNIQTPLLEEKFLGDDDAIHVSGDGTGFNDTVKVHGSLYLGGGWVLQNKLFVDNNLVVANGSVTGNSCVSVGGNAYIAGRLRIQNCPVEVQGSMRVGYIDPNGQNVTVGLSATGGDLYVDSVYNQSSITILARKSSDGASKGNIYLGKYYSGMNGIMEAQGDLEVASGIAAGAVTYSNGGYIKAGKDMLVNSAVDPSGNRFTFAGSHGFYVSGAETPVSTGLGALHEGPLFDGLTPGSYVTRADDLDELKDKLSTSAQKKPQPYQLSMDTFNLKQKKWDKWRDFAASVCGVGGQSALTADNWNCVYEYVQKSNPELMKNGYLYVDLTGQGNNTNEVGTSTLTHNFVFYRTDAPEPLRLYGNTPDSRVIWWLPNGGGQIQIVSTLSSEIYGVVYLGANSSFGGLPFKVHGQLMVANNANIFGNGAKMIETWFDKSVLNDLASQTGMMVGDGINTGTTATGEPMNVAEFYPLAPTLRVRSIAESLEESVVDTSNMIVLGPGVVFNPSYAIVQQGNGQTAMQIIDSLGISKVYTQGATAANCPISQVSGATPPWTTTNRNLVFFSSCSRKTSFAVYVLPASDVGMGKGVAQFRDAIRTIDEVVSGDTTYALDVLLNLNHLDGAGKLKFDFSGSTAVEGVDYVLTSPTGKVFDIASGATGTAPLQLQLKIIKDATNNEPDKIIRIQMTSVGNSNLLVSTPSVMLINLRDLNYNTKKLTWLSPYAENGGVVIVSNLGTVQVGGAPNERLIRQGAKVAIGAVPADNYKIASWTGACAGLSAEKTVCEISSMDADKEFGLTFKKKAFSLTLRPKNIAGGKITFAPTPDSVRVSGKDSILWYEAGTTVTATAVANTSPSPGYTFMGWTGDFAGRTSSPLTVMMDSNVVLGGAFAKPGESCFYDTYDGSLDNMWKPRTVDGAVSTRNWYNFYGWLRIGAGATSLLIADTTIQLNGEVEAKIDAGTSSDAWLDGIVLRADLSKGTYVSVGYRNAAFQDNHIRVCHKNEVMSNETCTDHANEIDPGAQVDLRVRALESSFLIYINSVLVATVTADGHDVPGYTGFMVRRTTDSFKASTFKWLDGAGCAETGNPPPEISSCRLETVGGATAEPLQIKQGDAMIMKATVKDVNGLVADAVRYTVTTTDGYATQSSQVIYSGGDIEYGVEKNTGVHKGVGTYLATLVAKDSRGGEAVCEKTFKVLAPDTNAVPVITVVTVDGSAYTGTNLTAGSTHALVVNATDDNTSLTYEISGDLGFMTDTNSAGTASFTLPATTNGSRNVNITVKDGKGGEATSQMTLKFTGASNSAPVILSCTANPSGGEVPLGVKFMAQAYDPDGDALTYNWIGGDGVSLTGEFPAMFTFRSAANHDVRLEVTDSKGAKSYCNVTVSTTPSTNRAPTSPVCTADKTSGTGGLITVKLTGSATDPDGDPVNFRWMLSNGEQVWGNPYSKVLADGNYSVTGIAVDSKGAETRCAPIKITNANTKPKVSLSATPSTGDMAPDGLGNVGLEVTFAPSVSDPDGDATTLAWSVSPSISGFAVDANKRYTFRAVGTYVVTLTATDTKGASASTTKTIIVTENHAPTVTCSASPSSPMIGEEVTWTATAADSDGDPLIATWSGTDGLSGSSKVVKTTYSTTGPKTATIVVKDEGKLEATATCQTTVVAYVSPCQLAGLTTLSSNYSYTFAAGEKKCFELNSDNWGKFIEVKNADNSGAGTKLDVKWFGNTANNDGTSCTKASATLTSASNVTAYVDRRGFKASTSSGMLYLFISNAGSLPAKLNISNVQSWQNGSECTTDVDGLYPDSW